MSFKDLGLSEPLLKALADCGYSEPVRRVLTVLFRIPLCSFFVPFGHLLDCITLAESHLSQLAVGTASPRSVPERNARPG